MDLFAIADKCKLIGFTTGNDIHKIGIYTVNENNKVSKKKILIIKNTIIETQKHMS